MNCIRVKKGVSLILFSTATVMFKMRFYNPEVFKLHGTHNVLVHTSEYSYFVQRSARIPITKQAVGISK